MKTTIAISTDIRDDINQFGFKGESYDDILRRILNDVKERQLEILLMDEKDTITAKEALRKAKEKWQE